MTSYAFDAQRREIVATWASGQGAIASTVVRLPDGAADDLVLRLVDRMTGLAAAAWRTYTHPASAEHDDDETNSEGWRRGEERQRFAAVLPALSEPNLPQDGMIVQSYSPVVETAHQVGRALHAIDSSDLTGAVKADLAAELDAIERAERGELAGRARQAVVLTRADASPLQVVAADEVLSREPFGTDALFTEIDSTAAAVAAAHWLLAAVTVASEQSELSPGLIVSTADDIQAIPVESPTLVIERLLAGETPREVVVDLVGQAMLVIQGHIPDLDAIVSQIIEAEQRAEKAGDRADEVRHAYLPDRLTPLDPMRPARDLLEDLLTGIHGCWLVYSEYADDDGAVEEFESDEEEAAYDRAAEEAAMEAFLDAVRAEAAAHRDRLL